MRRSGRVLLLSAAIGIAVTIFLASCAVKSRNAAPINPAVQKDLKANDVMSFDIFGSNGVDEMAHIGEITSNAIVADLRKIIAWKVRFQTLREFGTANVLWPALVCRGRFLGDTQ